VLSSDATQNIRKGGAIFIEVPCQDYEHKSFDDIQVSYHGQKIETLRSNSFFQMKWMALRYRLIFLGLTTLFAGLRQGMELLTNPIERAMVAFYEVCRESSQPVWWLRAIATKR